MSYGGPLISDTILVMVVVLGIVGAGVTERTGTKWGQQATAVNPVHAAVIVSTEIPVVTSGELNLNHAAFLQYAPFVQPCSPDILCLANNTVCSSNGQCICKEGFLLSYEQQCEPEPKKKNPGLFAVLLIVAGCVIATMIAVAIVCHFKRCYDPTTARGFQISQELLTTDNSSIEAPRIDDKPPSYDQVIQTELLQTVPPPNYIEATSRRCTAISCTSQDSLLLNEPAVLWLETTAIIHRMREPSEPDIALPSTYSRTPSLEIPLLSSLDRMSHASLYGTSHRSPSRHTAASQMPKIPMELQSGRNNKGFS